MRVASRGGMTVATGVAVTVRITIAVAVRVRVVIIVPAGGRKSEVSVAEGDKLKAR